MIARTFGIRSRWPEQQAERVCSARGVSDVPCSPSRKLFMFLRWSIARRRNVDAGDLKLFLTVARSGSISRAA